ncbi:hypothetical protein EPN87_03670 [archaeon]|nr:MAG: hypothetical protein EPN87_03670 [archaeon]
MFGLKWKWLENLKKNNKNWFKFLKIMAFIVTFATGWLTNTLLSGGISFYHHYMLGKDYDVKAIDIQPQYFSQTQKNLTVVISNDWSPNDLDTKLDVYSKPSNSGITFKMICDGSPCQKVIKVDAQSFKTINIVMDIGNIEQPFSICVKASKYDNDSNADEKCYQSHIISFPENPKS